MSWDINHDKAIFGSLFLLEPSDEDEGFAMIVESTLHNAYYSVFITYMMAHGKDAICFYDDFQLYFTGKWVKFLNRLG